MSPKFADLVTSIPTTLCSEKHKLTFHFLINFIKSKKNNC